MTQLPGWILLQKTVKSGWKSILDSSVRTTDVNNGIVMQSILHSFPANHHLFLTKLESGVSPGSSLGQRLYRTKA